MRTLLRYSAVVALAFQGVAHAAVAQIEVRFEHPEKFRDASLNSQGYERGADADVIKALTEHLQKLGQRYLQPGQRLRIDIRDIDLAGRFEPWHGPAYDVRFMRDITWPSIDLRYSLNRPGQPAVQAEDRISDKMYLSRPGRQASNDRLYAEKAMLSDWFRKQFAMQPTP